MKRIICIACVLLSLLFVGCEVYGNKVQEEQTNIVVEEGGESSQIKSSEQEMPDTVWDEDILPYINYDLLEDKLLQNYITMDSYVHMSFADLDMDGQREMLLTLPRYRGESTTLIYTVVNGEVSFCGNIVAGMAYNEEFDEIEKWPQQLIEAYVNGEGTIKWLSCSADSHGNFGSYGIYETSIKDNQLICEPVYAAIFTDDIYGYWSQETWDNWEEYELDNETYTILNERLEEHMSGYEKVELVFWYNTYKIPGNVFGLNEAQKDIVRSDIVTGWQKGLSEN